MTFIKPITKECLICNKPILIKYPSILERKKYCSIICRIEGKRLKEPDKYCLICNKKLEFEKPSIIKRRKYCSKNCYGKHISKRQRGKSNPYWKGGKKKNGGYVYILDYHHPKRLTHNYIAEHRLVMESHLNKINPKHPALDKEGYLKNDWDVHHKNGITDDNRIENLDVLSRIQHRKYHNSGEKNSNWKDGRTKKEKYCIDCNKKISWDALRCCSCHIIKNNKKRGKIYR